ncbi:copper homeostasis protein CutC [Lentibacillus sp. CBA3610]|uniref:copper homeostasis protein CutC n=1 Tax=Lentibacillus sp. CBA3610 TaxID=2518176 RepID=UPI001596148E|nr:copper homeostasis protein CutC [Lentibacillus sp. CBA3610]QKY70149.1 copper homeostasis protein CutC [Lentibacillus sp. CBA3610]
MKLEFIVQHKQEAIEAQNLGADRLELVSAISEGGLTPSYGTIQQVLSNVDIPVQVMVRPHSRHYVYTDEAFEVICEDIKAIQELGGNRIVFGALNQDKTINQTMLAELVRLFPLLDITFHRAFDETASQEDAYRDLLSFKSNVKRILTSGGEATCEKGVARLAKLNKQSHELEGPMIMPGAGLNAGNIQMVRQMTGAQEYHVGSAARIGRSFANGFDHVVVERLKTLLAGMT